MHDVEAVYFAAGGDVELGRTVIPHMIAAVARDHPDCLHGPANARIERKKRFWRARGVWPRPFNRGRVTPVCLVRRCNTRSTD